MFIKNKNRFKELSHTADVGIRAHGDNLEHVFANSLFGMYQILFGDITCKTYKEIKINLTENDLPGLLVSWLSELNYMLGVNFFIAREISNLKIEFSDTKYHLSATLLGDDSRNHNDAQLTEIKAVTYHQLYIKEEKPGYTAQIYFDI